MSGETSCMLCGGAHMHTKDCPVTHSVYSTTGNALEILSQDRDVWKAKALSAQANISELIKTYHDLVMATQEAAQDNLIVAGTAIEKVPTLLLAELNRVRNEVKRLAFRLGGAATSICPTNPTDVHGAGLGPEHCVSCLRATLDERNETIRLIKQVLSE